MNYYYVWLTVMLPSYANIINNELINKDYSVGKITNDYSLVAVNEGAPSCIIALKLTHASSDNNSLAKDLMDIFSKNKLICYSMVMVDEAGKASWQTLSTKIPDSETVIKEKVYN